MIDCPSAATAYRSDICLNESRRDVSRQAAYFSFGARGQDTRSRGAGAGSRGAIGDCCEQGLGLGVPDAPALNTRYPKLTRESKGA